jgi:hypothetical protein
MADAAQRGFRVARGEDRFGAHFGLGFGALAFKVSTADSGGALLVVELAHHAKGVLPVTCTTGRTSGSMSSKARTSSKWGRSGFG